jgi:hypothetical protein
VRVLLDECLPRRLGRELAGHDVDTVAQAGWSGANNGELLRRAAERYGALITIDQRFAEGRPVPPTLSLITLAAPSNRLDSLLPLVPAILRALDNPKWGERIRVGD